MEALSLACDPCSGHIDICWWCGDGLHTWMGPLNGRALSLGCCDVWCSLLEPWLLMMVPCWMMMALEALALDWWSPWWCSPWWWWSPCWRFPWRWSHLFFMPGWWLLDDGFGAMMFVELMFYVCDGCWMIKPHYSHDGDMIWWWLRFWSCLVVRIPLSFCPFIPLAHLLLHHPFLPCKPFLNPNAIPFTLANPS